MKKVLFVCTGNTCRSPMAKGIFNKICRERKLDMSADSAGVLTLGGDPVSQNSVDACKEIGIDISSHKSVPIQSLNLTNYDVFCAMTQSHKNALVNSGVDENKVVILGDGKHGIPDPYGGDLHLYIRTRDALQRAIDQLITKL